MFPKLKKLSIHHRKTQLLRLQIRVKENLQPLMALRNPLKTLKKVRQESKRKEKVMPVKKIPASPRLRGASKTTAQRPTSIRSRLKTAKGASKDSKFSVPVVDLTGKRKGSVELPKEIFGANVNEKLIAQAVRVYLVNQRQWTASTKTRGEVTGSTRKIYRQKGTGRARHVSITAPIFRGGGIVFGPRVRGFSLKLSKQMKKKALSSALAQKLLDQKVSVVDLEGVSGKTRELAQLFKNLKLLDKEKKDNQVLFVSASKGEAKRAARNIRGITVSNVESINTYEVLANKYLILARDAVPNLVNHFIKNNL